MRAAAVRALLDMLGSWAVRSSCDDWHADATKAIGVCKWHQRA